MPMNDVRTESHDDGFTMIELTIALVVAIVVLGFCWEALDAAAGSTRTTVLRSRLSAETQRLAERMASELMESSARTLNPIPIAPLGSPSLRYRQCVGVTNGALDWGPEKAFELQQDPRDPEDGVDNDEDGLTDECQVILRVNPGLPSEVTTVLIDNVASFLEGETDNGLDDNDNGLVDERGLCFSLDGVALQIWLTRQAPTADGRTISLTAMTSVSLRNR